MKFSKSNCKIRKNHTKFQIELKDVALLDVKNFYSSDPNYLSIQINISLLQTFQKIAPSFSRKKFY